MRRRGFPPPLSFRATARNLIPLGCPGRFLPDGRNDMGEIGRNDRGGMSWFMRRRGFPPPLFISSKARNPVPPGCPERFLPGGRNDRGGNGRNDRGGGSWFMRRRGFPTPLSFRAKREIRCIWATRKDFSLTVEMTEGG